MGEGSNSWCCSVENGDKDQGIFCRNMSVFYIRYCKEVNDYVGQFSGIDYQCKGDSEYVDYVFGVVCVFGKI